MDVTPRIPPCALLVGLFGCASRPDLHDWKTGHSCGPILPDQIAFGADALAYFALSEADVPMPQPEGFTFVWSQAPYLDGEIEIEPTSGPTSFVAFVTRGDGICPSGEYLRYNVAARATGPYGEPSSARVMMVLRPLTGAVVAEHLVEWAVDEVRPDVLATLLELAGEHWDYTERVELRVLPYDGTARWILFGHYDRDLGFGPTRKTLPGQVVP